MKNIARTLILAALVSAFARPLAAQFRSSVSYDHRDFSEDRDEVLRTRGAYITASYDLLSAGDNTEMVFALIAGLGVNRYETEGTGGFLALIGGFPDYVEIRRNLELTQIFGGVGPAFFVRRDIVEFHLSAIPGPRRVSISGDWCAIRYDYCESVSGSDSDFNVRMDLGLAAWIHQYVGLQAGLGADTEYSDDFHITVGVALRF